MLTAPIFLYIYNKASAIASSVAALITGGGGAGVGPVTHTIPKDGTAAYTSNVTITVAGLPFTLADAEATVQYIWYQPSGGSWAKLVNGVNGVSITSAANVITVSGAGTPFAAGDSYHIGITQQLKAYNATSDYYRGLETNPLDQKYLPEQQVDTTNLAADTYYYPDSDGFSMDGYKDFSVQYDLAGGVTLTIEAWIDDDASPVVADITPAGLALTTNAKGNASFVDVSGIVQFENICISKARIKVVTADATNTVGVWLKRKAL